MEAKYHKFKVSLTIFTIGNFSTHSLAIIGLLVMSRLPVITFLILTFLFFFWEWLYIDDAKDLIKMYEKYIRDRFYKEIDDLKDPVRKYDVVML